MDDPQLIRELEAQLIQDRNTLADLREREAQLVCHVSHKGFCTEAERNHLRCEMQVLERSVAKNQQMLAMARR